MKFLVEHDMRSLARLIWRFRVRI